MIELFYTAMIWCISHSHYLLTEVHITRAISLSLKKSRLPILLKRDSKQELTTHPSQNLKSRALSRR